METHFAQGKLIIQNENLDIHHKRKENYKGDEREAKRSKFECGAKAVVDGTSKTSKTTVEKGEEGLGSPKSSNDITKKSTLPATTAETGEEGLGSPEASNTKKSTLPAEASSKESITFEEALKDPSYWFPGGGCLCCSDDYEEEEVDHVGMWLERIGADLPRETRIDLALKNAFSRWKK